LDLDTILPLYLTTKNFPSKVSYTYLKPLHTLVVPHEIIFGRVLYPKHLWEFFRWRNFNTSKHQ